MTTFHEAEISVSSGTPIRLYKFQCGQKIWSYTSGSSPVVHSQKYLSLPGGITDNGIRQTGQFSADALKITAPANIGPALLFRTLTPSMPILITVFSMHAGFSDFLTVWAGEVSGIRFIDELRCEIACSPVTEHMRTPGLRMCWERTCPHFLYSARCGVDKENYKNDVVVTAVYAQNITCSNLATVQNGLYTAGLIKWTVDGQIMQRGIQNHDGTTIWLLGGSSGISPGQQVTLYPGCRQTVESCAAFDNLDNYGGIPHLPDKNPFNDSPF